MEEVKLWKTGEKTVGGTGETLSSGEDGGEREC